MRHDACCALGRGLPPDARVLDVGCGDGFHLDLLRRYGPAGWQLLGVDTDVRAVVAARRRQLDVELSTIEEAAIEPGSIDLALCIQTIEHVADPVALLRAIARVLRPGGRLYLITDSTDSPDFRLAKSRHWGGYHFPRHWNLFNKASMRRLAELGGLSVEQLGTTTSPVNWTYTVRNWLDDWGAPTMAGGAVLAQDGAIAGAVYHGRWRPHDRGSRRLAPGDPAEHTMTRQKPPVVVLGGGIAGLVAAHELARHGVDADVYEAGPRLAGMAASHTDPDGFSYDVGAHFVSNRFVAALGMPGPFPNGPPLRRGRPPPRRPPSALPGRAARRAPLCDQRGCGADPTPAA